ncbi:hypothetical protein ES703_100838 [subsurface metagenome]
MPLRYGESLQDLPRVIPSRDNSKCPCCGAHGFTILPWETPEYYDPLMIMVKCDRCGESSYIVSTSIKRSNGRVTNASRS